MLFAIVGMMLMAQATDLLLVFLALETMSIAVYVLTGLRRDQANAIEAAFKYFLLGAFASSFFLYGIAFIYGVTGTHPPGTRRRRDRRPVDVGQPDAAAGRRPARSSASPSRSRPCRSTCGRPTPTRARRRWSPASCRPGVKAAAVAAFARRVPLGARARWSPTGRRCCGRSPPPRWWWARWSASSQTNLKRMLAYSSIAHGGYLLVAIVAANDVGKASLLFYLAAYAVTNLGAFGIIALLGSRDHGNDDLRDYAGLAHSHPGAGRADDDLPAVARRVPADRRLHRQVVHLQRRGQRRLLRPGDHRRAVERGLGLLLPAHRRDDVHVRARRPPGAAADLARRAWPAWSRRSPRCSSSACCRRR